MTWILVVASVLLSRGNCSFPAIQDEAADDADGEAVSRRAAKVSTAAPV